ncbi:MAG: BrnT family toxin [Marinobacter adhaerens]
MGVFEFDGTKSQANLLIGKIGDKHWSAVVTYREGCTRLISVRRSRKKEVELYES